MPTRHASAAKKAPRSRKPRASIAAVTRSAGFAVGDVVVDAGMPSRVGTICRVVTAGSTYQVRFADDTQCAVAPHSALAAAPAGVAGPGCTPDC